MNCYLHIFPPSAKVRNIGDPVFCIQQITQDLKMRQDGIVASDQMPPPPPPPRFPDIGSFTQPASQMHGPMEQDHSQHFMGSQMSPLASPQHPGSGGDGKTLLGFIFSQLCN